MVTNIIVIAVRREIDHNISRAAKRTCERRAPADKGETEFVQIVDIFFLLPTVLGVELLAT